MRSRKNIPTDNIDNDITMLFYDSDETYGYRRLLTAIRSLGYTISENKLRKKIKKLGLICKIRIKKRKYKYEHSDNITKKNILNRNFKSVYPNHKYCVDITQIYTKKNIVYLNIIRDLFNGELVAFKTSYNCNSRLAEDTIDLLASKRNISHSIIHSDQGTSYTSKAYAKKLEDLNVIQSMSRKGCPYDNSLAENFFSIFKAEKLHRIKYQLEDIDSVNELVEEYILFFNNKRISTALGGLTPKQYYDKNCI